MNPERTRLLVASGPTREWIDPVRFITNPSSGATGWQIATAGVKQHAFREVVYVTGPVADSFAAVEGATNIAIETTTELRDAVVGQLADDTLLVMAAAPADFTPLKPATSKIKKEGRDGVTLEMTRAPDVLLSVDAVAANYRGLVRVGFAAETDNVVANASGKLKRKGLDYICANQVHQSRMGFGAGTENTLLVLDESGPVQEIGPAAKDRLAGELLAFLIKRLAAGRA